MDRPEIVGRGSQVGLVVASAAVPGTFTKSLSARSWLDQGIITALGTGTHYLVSVLAQDGIDIGGAALAPVLPLPQSLTDEQRRRVAILLLDVIAVPVGFGLAAFFGFRDQDTQLRALVRQVGLRVGVTGTGATLLAGALAGTNALDDHVSAGGRIARFPVGVPVGLAMSLLVERLRQQDNPPEHTTYPAATSPVAGLADGMGIVLVLAGVAAAEGAVARRLGSVGGRALPGSEIFWRRASHAATLAAVGLGTHAVWGGAMRGVEASTARYDDAVDESAAGVWTSPMISGDPDSLVRWDTMGREGRRHAIAYVRPAPFTDRPALVGEQNRPDLSIRTVMGEDAKASPIQVFVGLDSAPSIFQRVRAIPLERRPKVVLFGESLGALTSQDVLVGWGTLGLEALGIDRALWVGTPEGSRWMHEVMGEPRPDVDRSLVSMVNDYEQFCDLGDERKERVRYVLLSHDNDGVTKFGPSLINRRPAWLGPERPANVEIPGRSPRGIQSPMRWRMVTTFYQSMIDMKNAQIPGTYRAWAHDYRPDLADFIHDVFDLDCTPEQLECIKAACREREEFRDALFR